MRRSRVRRLWQGGALAVSAVLVVALGQSTTTAAFTGRTGDTSNQVTAKASFCGSVGQTVPLTVVSDTAVYQAYPTTSYGSNANVGVASGVSVNALTYLRFNVATRAPIPPRCRVADARLSIYATSGAGPVRPLEAHRANGAWNTSVTWDTPGRPGPAGTPATTSSRTTAGWQEWDVTVLTRELYSGADHGFLMKEASSNASPTQYQYWSSMDAGSNLATLTITWG